MRPEVWTGLVVMVAAFTVRSVHAKSLANVGGEQRIHSLRRSVRDASSSSPVPASASSPSNTSPLMSDLPLMTESPDTSTPLPSSTVSSASSQASSISQISNSPASFSSISSFSIPTSMSTPSVSTFPSPSLPSTTSFSPPSTWPSTFLPSSLFPHSSFPSSSPQSSPASLSPFPSRSLPKLTSSTSFAPYSFSTPPYSSQSLPSSSPLPTSPSFHNPPSPPLPFSIQSQFFSSMSLTFELLSSSFQLLSSSFQMLSSSFQLLSNSYQLPISPNEVTLPSVPTSPPHSSSSSSLPPSDWPNGFWSNGSFIGLELDCDDAAKYCLSIGRLLFEPTGQCYQLGDTRPCGNNGDTLVVDAEALQSGQLRAVCRRNEPCDGLIMAFDGQCYDPNHARINLCNNSATIVPYPTGLYECACYEYQCFKGTDTVHQPTTSGRCVLPDLNRPPIEPFQIPCSADAENCLLLRLFFEGECYLPLANASCPEDQWLVLDERASNLSATCVSKQPCGPGEQKLHADGLCHSEEEIRDKLCPGETLHPLPNGDMQCSTSSFFMFADGGGVCTVTVYENEQESTVGVITGLNSDCGRDNDNECSPKVNQISSGFASLF